MAKNINKNRRNRNINGKADKDSRPIRRGRDKTEKYVDEEGKEYPLNNNPLWYFDDKTLADQVSSISFNQILGSSNTFTSTNVDTSIPVSMVLYFNPSIGWNPDSRAGFSGINQAGIKLYTALSAGNAKTTNYAPQDVTTLMLALGEILSLSEHLRRAFGLAFTYNKRNWAYARDIIQATGVDADDLFLKMANYRIRFNTVVNQINKITFPANIRYFEKCVYMYSHIFLDSDSPMSQTYIYRPYSTWIVDEDSFEEGTILKTVLLPDDTVWTMDKWLDQLEALINAVMNSATFNYIYADVLRLFGDGGSYTVPFCGEDYIVVPESDPLARLQINNATLMGKPLGIERDADTTPSNDVYPVVALNRLAYCPQFGSKVRLGRDTIINFPHSMGNPDETQRIEATRFTSLTLGGEDWTTEAALPDHYVVKWTVFGPAAERRWTRSVQVFSQDDTPSLADIRQIGDQYMFESSPRTYVIDVNSGNGPVIKHVIGDLDYFTTVDMQYLSRVNDLAFSTLFT